MDYHAVKFQIQLKKHLMKMLLLNSIIATIELELSRD